MLKEYYTKYYFPAGELGSRVYSDGCKAAQVLAEWERHVQGAWPQVSITASGPERGEMTMGKPLVVEATLLPGALSAEDIAVELVCVREGNGRPIEAVALPMHRTGTQDGAVCYEATFDVPESGRFAYGVRARPQHRGPAQPVRRRTC